MGSSFEVNSIFLFMGLLRLLLALVVILEHTESSWKMIGGDHAVEAFFIISGFLMALILNSDKYKGAGGLNLFYTNRILRLFPLFWLFTFLVYAVSFALWKTGQDPAWLTYYIEWGDKLAPGTWAYLVWVNIAALGQDVAFFLGIDQATGQLHFVKNFRHTNPPVYLFLGIGQAWSLSVEMWFYMMAPFLVRRKHWLLIGLLVAAALFRYRLFRSSFSIDPWTGRFLPAEMVFFLAGIVGYLAYTRLRTMAVPTWLMRLALALVVVLTIGYPLLPWHWLTPVAYFTVFAMCLPLIFMLTKTSKRDAKLGEYSFPIYISHTLPLYFIHRFCVEKGWSSDVEALLEILCVLPISWLVIRYVEGPIERFRARRAKRL
jgi:peptidoglycan/LPS O-acetylase OafA/YrhL